MRYSLKLVTVSLTFLSMNISLGQIKLLAIITSEMVLQRNAEVNLWGWSKANEIVKISTSWMEETVTVKAHANGKWQAIIKTNYTRGEQEFIISSKSGKRVFKDVLLGEVWICSGQSNMSQPLKGFSGQPTFSGLDTIVSSNNKDIRLFKVNTKVAREIQDDLKGFVPWQKAAPNPVKDFSAVAYFFGKQLQEILDVPVGLIQISRSSNSVQAWMSHEILINYQDIYLSVIDVSKKNRKVPTVLFKAMVHPIIPYTIQGALWYQGEGNQYEPEEYKILFPSMVKDWRDRWGRGDFFFYFVQIAPYKYEGNNFFQDIKNTAFQREAQLQCAELIPNSGIAIITDISAEHYIHPPNKRLGANRLLFHALDKTYSFELVDSESQNFHSMTEKDKGLLLAFNHAEQRLFFYGELAGYEIAGENHVFYPAKASIIEKKGFY